MSMRDMNDRRNHGRKHDNTAKKRRRQFSRSRSLPGGLLDSNHSVHWKPDRNNIPYAAIREGNKNKIKDYLNDNINSTRRINELLIHACGKAGAPIDVVKMIIEYSGVKIDYRDDNQWSPLHHLCYQYCGPDGEAILKLLLDQGASIDLKTEKGATPLHHATQKDQKELISLLIERKADVNAADCHGQTPLHCAVHKGQKELISFLIERKADVNASDCSGYTPLHCAIHKGHKELTSFLMEHKADVNAIDCCGYTPLHFASKIKEASIPEIVEELIKHGASMDLKNNKGDTALDIANKVGNSQIVQVFEEKIRGNDLFTSSPVSVSDTSAITSSPIACKSHQRPHTNIMSRLEILALEVCIELDRSRGVLTHTEVLEDKIYEKVNPGRISDRVRIMEYELGIVD